jgi:hypothetical protein
MDILATIHAQVEESLIQLAVNVYVLLATGTEAHALFAQILKYGQLQN